MKDRSEESYAEEQHAAKETCEWHQKADGMTLRLFLEAETERSPAFPQKRPLAEDRARPSSLHMAIKKKLPPPYSATRNTGVHTEETTVAPSVAGAGQKQGYSSPSRHAKVKKEV